ncbi:hypothetical protein NEOKW01_1719 [Nematocida sp. AWRm80]|nr:hypothetical protein NEOKW01_1719 [Nematocida sp. AWRm80]
MNTKQSIERLKTLEKQMNTIITQLETEYSYSIGDKLVDTEDYPRADIDVYSISKLLSEYREINKEWRVLREKIEEEISLIFSKDK